MAVLSVWVASLRDALVIACCRGGLTRTDARETVARLKRAFCLDTVDTDGLRALAHVLVCAVRSLEPRDATVADKWAALPPDAPVDDVLGVLQLALVRRPPTPSIRSSFSIAMHALRRAAADARALPRVWAAALGDPASVEPTSRAAAPRLPAPEQLDVPDGCTQDADAYLRHVLDMLGARGGGGAAGYKREAPSTSTSTSSSGDAAPPTKRRAGASAARLLDRLRHTVHLGRPSEQAKHMELPMRSGVVLSLVVPLFHPTRCRALEKACLEGPEHVRRVFTDDTLAPAFAVAGTVLVRTPPLGPADQPHLDVLAALRAARAAGVVAGVPALPWLHVRLGLDLADRAAAPSSDEGAAYEVLKLPADADLDSVCTAGAWVERCNPDGAADDGTLVAITLAAMFRALFGIPCTDASCLWVVPPANTVLSMREYRVFDWGACRLPTDAAFWPMCERAHAAYMAALPRILPTVRFCFRAWPLDDLLEVVGDAQLLAEPLRKRRDEVWTELEGSVDREENRSCQ